MCVKMEDVVMEETIPGVNEEEVKVDIIYSDLSIVETQIVNKIYGLALQFVRDIVMDPDISDFVLLIRIITKLCGLVECLKTEDGKLKGETKKKVVLHIIRSAIKDALDSERAENILLHFEKSGEDTIEYIIEFAKYNKFITKFKNSFSFKTAIKQMCCFKSIL